MIGTAGRSGFTLSGWGKTWLESQTLADITNTKGVTLSTGSSCRSEKHSSTTTGRPCLRSQNGHSTGFHRPGEPVAVLFPFRVSCLLVRVPAIIQAELRCGRRREKSINIANLRYPCESLKIIESLFRTINIPNARSHQSTIRTTTIY